MKAVAGAFVAVCLIVSPLQAHEFWIAPDNYRLPPDASITGELVQGEHFSGSSMPYYQRRFHRFELRRGDDLVSIKGRDGDDPALDVAALGDGLHVIIHQTKLSLVTYETLEKFEDFLESKRLAWGIEAHRARGLPDKEIREAYFRYAKALVKVGNGRGPDRPEGLPFELVALSNPYSEPDRLRVRLLFKDEPYADADLHLFHRTADGVAESWYKTDAKGEAEIPLAPGEYLLNAVHLQEASEKMTALFGAVWQTLWASLTFEISR